MGGAFAAGCDEIKGNLPDTNEMRSAVDRCIAARKSSNPNAITDFVCPQGEFIDANKQVLNNEVVSYIVGVQVSFNKIDKNIIEFMKKLQENRDPDPAKWVENIRTCSDKIKERYAQICAFGTIENILNTDSKKPYITTTMAYPQELCSIMANKKIEWWYKLWTILMGDGIAKNQQNSKDIWVTEVKWAYSKVLGKWHTYQKILGRSVSKMTGYIRESN
jgi:hypothetical protein